MKKTSTLLLFLVSIYGFSQEYKLEDAQKTTSDFLQSLKILDLPEGKELLSKLVFDSTKSFPVVSNGNRIFDKLFDTDIDGIKGYKALLEIQSLSKGNTPMTLRYLLISYLSKKENKWKVFSFRKIIDTEKELVFAKERAFNDKDSYTKVQYRIRNLGYWQIMNGKLKGAIESFLKAYKEAEENGDSKFGIPTYLILDEIIDFRNFNTLLKTD